VNLSSGLYSVRCNSYFDHSVECVLLLIDSLDAAVRIIISMVVQILWCRRKEAVTEKAGIPVKPFVNGFLSVLFKTSDSIMVVLFCKLNVIVRRKNLQLGCFAVLLSFTITNQMYCTCNAVRKTFHSFCSSVRRVRPFEILSRINFDWCFLTRKLCSFEFAFTPFWRILLGVIY